MAEPDEHSREPELITAGWADSRGGRGGAHSHAPGEGGVRAATCEATPTLLRRDTAREMHVLKSSGFFLQRQVMRLTAAVTTPCRDRGAAGQGPGRRADGDASAAGGRGLWRNREYWGWGQRSASLCRPGRPWAQGNLWVSETEAGTFLRGWVGVGVGDPGRDPWAASWVS